MKKILLWGLILFLLLGTGAMFFGIVLPLYFGKQEISLSGPLTMEQALGGWMLSWPENEKADRYQVELLQLENGQEQVIYREFVIGTSTVALPNLPEDQVLSIRVTPAVRFRTLLGEDYHYSEASLQAQAVFETLPVPAQEYSINGDHKTLTMTMPEDTRWQYRLTDESGTVLAEERLSEPTRVLQFGGDSPIALPQPEESYHLRTRFFREEPNLLIFGMVSEDFAVTEESLRFRKLNPSLEMVSKNTVQITWEETQGARYEVQALDAAAGSWSTLATVAQGENRSYRDLLEPEQTKQYRIAAVDDAGKQLQVSEEMTATGRDRVQYATVWPVKDLPVYDSPSGGRVIGTARVGTAFCVLEEKNSMFALRFEDETGYISSNYCMINLPEYLGGLCSYKITNSTYAIYAIHEFAIENVTGVVTTGYENICQQDGSYLVPLIYPAAKRLLTAAQSALEQGYRLKIYDSFRPHKATLEIYDLTSQIMANPVPDATYLGIPKESMDLPNPRPGWEYLSLGWLMTGSNYEQNSFLARGGSAHNRGIALDLTLETWDTGEEIQMQTSMHDLSQYSVLHENNEAADILGNIMHKAGFAGLISEWWHFQDDHAKSAYNLPYVSEGVDAECWVKDDLGWKYRDAKGNFRQGESIEISGKQYTFDNDGYVVE